MFTGATGPLVITRAAHLAAPDGVSRIPSPPRFVPRPSRAASSAPAPGPGLQRAANTTTAGQPASASAGAPAPLTGFFAPWLEAQVHATHANVEVLRERPGSRASVIGTVCSVVEDHLIGASVLAAMGAPQAAAMAAARIPVPKRVRSGDLGEILAAEYVQAHTDFDVLVKRLRHKDDRDLAMRGDDIIGVRRSAGRPRMLKGEVKSRASLASGVVSEACTALAKHQGRPNPHTLAFIAQHLRLEGRDTEAARVEDLMTQRLSVKDVAHLVFTLSGNDPSDPLAAHATPTSGHPDRRLIGLVVDDHPGFVGEVFANVMSRYVGPGTSTTTLAGPRPAEIVGGDLNVGGVTGTASASGPSVTMTADPEPLVQRIDGDAPLPNTFGSDDGMAVDAAVS